MHRRFIISVAFTSALLAGCATSPPKLGRPDSQVQVAFSPDGGAEALVLQTIGAARQSLRLAGYAFTAPTVVRGLIEAKRRGVDVRVLLDERGNHGKASVAAINLIAGAGIPTRDISVYAIHHDKYIVIDERHTETGSFNYSQAASRDNSENVIVIWDNADVAKKYLAHWEDRWRQGIEVELKY